MSLDGAFLRIVTNEWKDKGLIGARVDKIHQPSKDELVLSLRTVSGTHKLLMSANPGAARVCLTENAPENPGVPPMFCMLLRKHLGGSRLENISQDGLERIVNLDFNCTNEVGDIVKNRLAIEIMGRSSNIILSGEPPVADREHGELRITDAIKRVTDETSSVRRVLPGVVYEPPPREPRLTLYDFSRDELFSLLNNERAGRLSKVIIKLFEGVSPVFAREAAHYCAKDIDVSVNEILNAPNCLDRLYFFLEKGGAAITVHPCLTMVKEKNGKPSDFCFVNIEQYANEMLTVQYESANLLLDEFFGERSLIERNRQRSGELLKQLMRVFERVSRRVGVQRSELADCRSREDLRLKGDIITANIYRLKKGDVSLSATDYNTGTQIEIPLYENLNPAQNAQKYYSDYKKLDTAEKKLKELIRYGEQELVYLDSVFDAATRAKSDAEFNEIRIELGESGYLNLRSQKHAKGNKNEKPIPPLKFKSSEGLDILVGRNNKNNERLTLKMAKPDDIWLHAKEIPGSHVVISGEANEQSILEAARLAAEHSKARDAGVVPVDYTLVKYVKKPVGAKPGMVIYKHNKTLYVRKEF
ncbi:MAG: NFACT RNA binding domain-containing protein [Oscillospiraceae bacterium]|nr:NFACT RNA binding domain-containing protein [Oscillospiraceae bacterium]